MKQKGQRGKADGKERIAAWYEDEIAISDSFDAKLLHFVLKTSSDLWSRRVIERQ